MGDDAPVAGAGRLHTAAGDHRAAIADLLAVGQPCESWELANPAMVPWRPTAAESLARVGDRDRAAALADDEVELARRWGAPRAIGVGSGRPGSRASGANAKLGIASRRQLAAAFESH